VKRIRVAQDRHKRRALVYMVLLFSATQFVVRINTVRYLWITHDGRLDGTYWIVSVGSSAGLGTLGKRRLQEVLEIEILATPDGHCMQFV
jgi:hypothetical protein